MVEFDQTLVEDPNFDGLGHPVKAVVAWLGNSSVGRFMAEVRTSSQESGEAGQARLDSRNNRAAATIRNLKIVTAPKDLDSSVANHPAGHNL